MSKLIGIVGILVILGIAFAASSNRKAVNLRIVGAALALQVLVALQSTGTDLASLRRGMTKFPQHMINVRIDDKLDLDAHPELAQAVADTEAQMGGRGRVLLRVRFAQSRFNYSIFIPRCWI